MISFTACDSVLECTVFLGEVELEFIIRYKIWNYLHFVLSKVWRNFTASNQGQYIRLILGPIALKIW